MLTDARSDLVSLLSFVPGIDANNVITKVETVVRQRAIEGVDAALAGKVPSILAKVREEAAAKTRMYYLGAIGLGGIGLIFALVANKRARACR